MLTIDVKQSWFENYWYAEHARSGHRMFLRRLSQVAICILLILGSVAVLSRFGSSDLASHLHARTHFKFM